MNRNLLAVSICAALGACATVYPLAPPPPPPAEEAPPPPAPFAARDFQWSTERGSASIHVQVAFSRDNQHFSCAGQQVVLMPETPYSRSRMATLYGSDQRAALPVTEVRSRQGARPSSDLTPFIRRAACDGQDRFGFEGLPAGGWYVIVAVQPTSGGGEQMALMIHVRTRAGLTRSVLMDSGL